MEENETSNENDEKEQILVRKKEDNEVSLMGSQRQESEN